MTQCWTRDLCIWHYTWWRNVGLVICVSDIIHDDAMLDSWSVSDIIHDDAMLDSWPKYLTLYRMMLDSWSVYLTFTEWCHVGLMICVSDIYRMMPCWTHDLCIWHYTEWLHVGLVICVSDIYRMMPCWTRDLCIWHCTEWRHVGLMICASDIVQNDAMLDSWSVHLTLYRMTQCWTRDLVTSFCIMLDKQIISPTWHHSV